MGLNLTLFGGFQARLGAGPILRLRTRQTQALLAYLALSCGRAHPRDKLAAFLWGHLAQGEARHRLRQALFALRRALAAADLSHLSVDGSSVVLDPAGVEVDAVVFEALLREGSPDALERAATLYRGDLLQGLPAQGPHPSDFEEWLAAERERLRELALETLAKLVSIRRAAGAPELALSTVLRLLALDPLQEAAHRTAMHLQVQLGRRTAALRQYQHCVSQLRRELNVEPEEETRQLYRDILRRRTTVGVTGPVVRPAGGAAADSRSVDAPLVGRDVETHRLRAWLAKASRGSRQVALLVGETGVGKSRLVAELLVEAEIRDAARSPSPFRVLTGRCHDGEQVLAFGPWIDALRAQAADYQPLLDDLQPVWRAELFRLLPELRGRDVSGPSDPPDATRLFEAVRQLLATLIRRSAVVVVLEDLHWADEMSLRLLQFIACRTPAWPLLLVGTVREEELPEVPLLRQTLESLEREPHVERLRVTPLSRRATGELVRALSSTTSKQAALEQVGEEVWRASEGNPFVIIETMRALQQGIPLAAPGGLPLPERVQRVIARRMERLSEAARDLVTLAAVIGRRFEFDLLQGAARRDEVATAAGVEELVRRQVLHEVAGALDFVHERVRAVVYADLSGPTRRMLHSRIVQAIEASFPHRVDEWVEQLAHHALRAQMWEKAWCYARQAGSKAASRSAFREAAGWFEQALDVLAELPEGREVLAQAVDVRLEVRNLLYPLGEHGRILGHLQEAERVAGTLADEQRLGWVATYMSNYFWREGAQERAVGLGLKAAAIARKHGELALQMTANIRLGQAYYASGRYGEAVVCLRQNLTMLGGNLDRARFGVAGLPSVFSRSFLMLCLAEIGSFPEAIDRAEEAVRIADEAGDRYGLGTACFASGYVHLLKGELQRARALAERGLDLCRASDIPTLLSPLLAVLGGARARQGEVAGGLSLLEKSVESSTFSWSGQLSFPFVFLGEAELLGRRHVEAGQTARRVLERVRGRSERGWEAWTIWLLGEVAAHRASPDVADAAHLYQESLARATGLCMRPLVAHCHLGLGKLHGAGGKHQSAQEFLTTATTMYREMGMTYWLEKAERPMDGGPAD